MNDLIIFYLMTSATHVIPLIFISLILIYGTPFPFLSNIMRDLPPVHRILRNIGVARLENFFEIFDPDMKEYLAACAVTACALHISTVIFIISAINNNVPLPFMPDINDLLPPGVVLKLLKFSVTTGVIQLIPVLLLIIALLFDIPIPFMPLPPENRVPPSAEITRWEQQSQDFASIRLTRFETEEKKFIYAKCQNDRSGAVFKLALCQAKEEGSGTECYLYDEGGQNLQQITPAPITVNELEEIFSPGDE